MKAILAALALTFAAAPALACGGSGYSGASPAGAASKEAQLQAAIQRSAEIDRQIAALDKAIAVAKVVDLAVGLAVKSVPHGSKAYAAGKTVGYAITGNMAAAAKAAFSGALGTVTADLGALGKAVDIGMTTVEVVTVTQDVSRAFGK